MKKEPGSWERKKGSRDGGKLVVKKDEIENKIRTKNKHYIPLINQ